MVGTVKFTGIVYPGLGTLNSSDLNINADHPK